MRSDSLKKMAVSILGLVFFMSGCSQSESTEAPAEQLAKTTRSEERRVGKEC